MSVLVKGMEKPEHCGYCRFRYGGICHALQKTQYSMDECPLVGIDDAGLNDTISRQAAIKAICEDGTWLESQGCTDISMAERKQRDADILGELQSAEPEQRYTEEELRVFQHGISLSLLSKRSAQRWQYDEDTATEIKFLERLYEKVGADIRGEEV